MRPFETTTDICAHDVPLPQVNLDLTAAVAFLKTALARCFQVRALVSTHKCQQRKRRSSNSAALARVHRPARYRNLHDFDSRLRLLAAAIRVTGGPAGGSCSKRQSVYKREVNVHTNPPSALIGLSVPHMEDDVRAALADSFTQNWVAHVGPTVDAFELELAEHVGVPSTFATNSGTSALHLALRLCGVGAGDVVFCSSLTFIASANSILYQGAQPVFIDSDPETWGMSARALARALHEAKRSRKLPKAIIVVHLYGQSADMDPIVSIAKHFGVPVIEDAAEALGSTYRGRACGTMGLMGVYSFAGNKIISTSTGGALVSHDPALVARARYLGMQARERALHYEHSELGYNYRMSNVLAGIGRSQLRVLEQRVRARRAVFARCRDALTSIREAGWMPESAAGRSNRWLSVLTLAPGCSTTPAELVAQLAARQIEARRVFQPLHLQPLYRHHLFYAHDDRSICEDLFARGVCLPSSSSLSADDQRRVIAEVGRALRRDVHASHAAEPLGRTGA
ncbi:MAG: pyridoxal phosphate-dependent aminotransferase [Myxococcaceae bacterium]|nr:pyridoxal phosphate-dependent aminotransferase [Myxococcaceae bacterium]